MPVVINDFEVVPEPPANPLTPTPPALPPEPVQIPRIELEHTLSELKTRLERVHAD